MTNHSDIIQTHGDHMSPFFKDGNVVYHFNEMIQASEPVDDPIETQFTDEETNRTFSTTILPLKFDVGKISFLFLLAMNEKKESYVFVSCYPYLQGLNTEVEILEVLEWRNQIEATIRCKYRTADGDFEFSFFATDYYVNKHQYRPGAKLTLNIAASGLYAEEGSAGFEFTGQQAVDFLAKMGQKPTYNERGEIEPVKFSTANTVVFIAADETTPDIAECMSPITLIEEDMQFMETRISCGEILLHRDPDFKTILYYSSGVNIHPGHPIMGNFWISGRIAQ